MEIYNNKDKGFFTVWLTNKEQKQYNLNDITGQLLKSANPKCKVVFFLSGHEDLIYNTEGLLLANLKNV